MITENQPEKSICAAIIGVPNPIIIDFLMACEIPASNIHIIKFVEASSRDEWNKWINSKQSTKIGIGLGSGGCLLAHRDAWLTLRSCSHDILLVLEDDAIFTPFGKKHFKYFLNQIKKSNYLLVHLGSHIKYSLDSILRMFFKLNIRELVRVFLEYFLLKAFKPKLSDNRFPFSGHAYFLNSYLANILLDTPENFLYPVDVHLNSISQVSANRVASVRTPMMVQADKRISHIKIRGR